MGIIQSSKKSSNRELSWELLKESVEKRMGEIQHLLAQLSKHDTDKNVEVLNKISGKFQEIVSTLSYYGHSLDEKATQCDKCETMIWLDVHVIEHKRKHWLCGMIVVFRSVVGRYTKNPHEIADEKLIIGNQIDLALRQVANHLNYLEHHTENEKEEWVVMENNPCEQVVVCEGEDGWTHVEEKKQ